MSELSSTVGAERTTVTTSVASTEGTSTTATSTPSSTTMTKRRMTNRDNKLMSVLQARRTALSRRKEYIHHPSSTSSLKARQQASVAGNLVEDSSTPESNLIVPVSLTSSSGRIASVDEFLDTDESIHGMYVVNPRTGKIALQQTGSSIKLAKETNNFIAAVPAAGNKSLEITKLISAKGATITNAPITSTIPTTLHSGRSLYLETRGKRLRDRKTFPQLSTERSVEESDLIPYQFFGQKLLPAHHKGLDARNQVINSRRTHLNKLKEDPLSEMNDANLPKPSTEKSKFWSNRYQSRNVVALNNYLRRGGSVPITTTTTTTTTTTLSPSTTSYSPLEAAPVHSDALTNSMIALSNLSDGNEAEEKQVFLRSANFTTPNRTEEIDSKAYLLPTSNTKIESLDNGVPSPITTTTTTSEPPNKSLADEYSGPAGLYGSGLSSGISKLIINYPDDATPEDFYRPLNTFETHAQIVNLQEATEDPVPTTSVPAIDEDYDTPRNLVSLPDINQIFRNLSTPTTTEMTTTSTTQTSATSTAATVPARSRLNTRVYVPVSRSTTIRTSTTPRTTTTSTTTTTTTTSTTTTEQPVEEETESPTTVLILTSNPTTTESSIPSTTPTRPTSTEAPVTSVVPSVTPSAPARTTTSRHFRPSAPPTVGSPPKPTRPTMNPPEHRTVAIFTGLRPNPPEPTPLNGTEFDLSARSFGIGRHHNHGHDHSDVSGFSEDLEQGVVYFNRRISEFECEI
uniref:Mucin-5AC n=1 Tax=Anopheles minimus TaxID=112268 RepID=A0A182WC02_9DIPT